VDNINKQEVQQKGYVWENDSYLILFNILVRLPTRGTVGQFSATLYNLIIDKTEKTLIIDSVNDSLSSGILDINGFYSQGKIRECSKDSMFPKPNRVDIITNDGLYSFSLGENRDAETNNERYKVLTEYLIKLIDPISGSSSTQSSMSQNVSPNSTMSLSSLTSNEPENCPPRSNTVSVTSMGGKRKRTMKKKRSHRRK
jgi:hypothetical protein